jgi:hypothetical protein
MTKLSGPAKMTGWYFSTKLKDPLLASDPVSITIVSQLDGEVMLTWNQSFQISTTSPFCPLAAGSISFVISGEKVNGCSFTDDNLRPFAVRDVASKKSSLHIHAVLPRLRAL